MSKKEKKKKSLGKELLITFVITCLLQGIVIGLTVWYQSTMFNGRIGWEWNTADVWLWNVFAFVLMFIIVFCFVKKPKDDDQYQDQFDMK